MDEQTSLLGAYEGNRQTDQTSNESKTDASHDQKEDSRVESSQKDLDWRAKLPKELQTDKTLLRYKTSEEAFRGLIELNKTIGVNIRQITESKNIDELSKTFKSIFKIEDDQYGEKSKLDNVTKEIGRKLNIPEYAAKEISESVLKVVKKQSETDDDKLRETYKKDITSNFNDTDELNKNLFAALKKYNMTAEEYKENFGLNGMKPQVLSLFNKIGEDIRKDGITQISEGSKTGDLPSSIHELNAMHKMESASLAQTRIAYTSKQATRSDIESKENKLEQIRAKIRNIGGVASTNTIF